VNLPYKGALRSSPLLLTGQVSDGEYQESKEGPRKQRAKRGSNTARKKGPFCTKHPPKGLQAAGEGNTRGAEGGRHEKDGAQGRRLSPR